MLYMVYDMGVLEENIGNEEKDESKRTYYVHGNGRECYNL